MEDLCYYINSRGILKICDIFSKNISSSNQHIDKDILDRLHDGDSLYICTSAIPNFAKYVPNLNKSIVLVSGDSDDTTPGNDINVFNIIVSSKYIKKWFAQNCIINHSKVVHLPIGIYYHNYYNIINGFPSWTPLYKTASEQEKDINSLLENKMPFWKRVIKCYSTFHFQLNRGDRQEVFNQIPSHLIDYEQNPVPRLESHSKQLLYAFVISPFGCGPDTHRTWEALICGCIPIIKSSNMDELFADLPVLLVKKWSWACRPRDHDVASRRNKRCVVLTRHAICWSRSTVWIRSCASSTWPCMLRTMATPCHMP
jgi:hypothetical protein